jgi:transitional endoplasmic reticulum ATPase
MSKESQLMKILGAATAVSAAVGDQDIWDPDMGIEQRGDKFVIPEHLSLEKAAKWLSRFAREQEEMQELEELIDGHPLDVLVQLSAVMREHFGWASASHRTVMTMFGKAKAPPIMVTVPTGPDTNTDVPWGDIQMPGDIGHVTPGIHIDGHVVQFSLGGEVKKKALKFVRQLMDEVRDRLKTKSIYRGKAFRMKFVDFREERYHPRKGSPQFLRTEHTDPARLIFRRSVEDSLMTNLFTPIMFTDKCREQGIPLKRGVLLEGDYGVGKTMTAEVIAKLCEDNGWTFISLDNTEQIHWALEFAKRYGPAVVFAEDIDQVFPAGHTNSDADSLIRNITNSMDAVDNKHGETMLVLTTNHLKQLSRAILRPGRLDALVRMELPDAEATGRLIELYASDRLQDGTDISEAMQLMAESTPALIRECVERSKLAAIKLGEEQITGEALRMAANSLQTHRAVILGTDDAPKQTLDEKTASIRADATVKAAQIIATKDPEFKANGKNGESDKPLPPHLSESLRSPTVEETQQQD